MSATIAGCGHPECFHTTEYITKSPQIHIHFLTEDASYKELGYGTMELCCHGCGQSLLLYYNDLTMRKKNPIPMKTAFKKAHKDCPNFDYEERCPPIRLGIEVKDLRIEKKNKRSLTRVKKNV